ncbi:hypothetical protein WME79_34495 [Sorangium sp. So ce726]|uniref:hypothetical protein n=1 Tax=Sorangium sp. So ce726 TaxID=3133319 RepID=UPI003F630125
MARKIITAITGMSLFVGVAMAHASTPAAPNLKAGAVPHPDARAATSVLAACSGMPVANVNITTNIGIAGIAINTSGTVTQSAIAQAGGVGNFGLSAANGYGGRGLGGRGGFGRGGWRRVAMNEAPDPDRADILFDN